MSVWSDMGIFDGRMNAVIPCVFLNTLYGFFQKIREKTLPEYVHIRDWDFSLLRKAGYWGEEWRRIGDCLTFPTTGLNLGRPVPESYWNSVPRWSTIMGLDEKTILGEDVIPWPYYAGGDIKRPAIMDPSWPLQRHKLVQKMRYISVPLKVRTLYYMYSSHSFVWTDYNWTYGSIDTDYFDWCGQDKAGEYRQVEAEIPEYWRQGNTVCKIGYEGGWYWPVQASEPPPPINGCAWHSGNRYLSAEYTEQYSFRGFVRLYGVADLSTHPDFTQYFDINE